MPKQVLQVYRDDDSGSHTVPYPGSNVKSYNRVFYLSHGDVVKALGGSGLKTSLRRYIARLRKKLDSLEVSEDEWVKMPDYRIFLQDQVGAAFLEGVFSPKLLELSPNFLRDMWVFDRAAPKFGKMLPRFLMPKAYQARDRLVKSVRDWHSYAREHFDTADINTDDGTDPYWGTELVRSRQKKIIGVDKLDYEAMAIVNFGLMWGSLTNVIPSLMMTSLYTFRDPELRDNIRRSLEDVIDDGTHDFNIEKLSKKTLLSSVYAETLRLHVQAIIARDSPRDIEIGRWWIPRNKMCMINSYASHMDGSFWNSRDGAFPVEKFWAERFIIDPKDPDSGPVKRDIPEKIYKRPAPPDGHDEDEPHLSVDGLKGSWIPYGGGYSACPGRNLAKLLILYTTASLLRSFDMVILTTYINMDWSTFDLGSQSPQA